MSLIDLYESTEHRKNLAHFAAIVNLANADGEINTMIAPVRSMTGDTLNVKLQFSENEPIGELDIILE